MFKQAVGQSQREQIVAAMAALAGSGAYASVSVERVIRFAGVSRATFYRHFDNRDECLRAAYRQTVAPIWRRLGDAHSAPGEDWLRSSLDAGLHSAATDPDRARFVLECALGASAEVRAKHEQLISAVEKRIADAEPFVSLPPLALLGAVAGVVAARLRKGEAASLPALLDPLLAWMECFSTGSSEPSCSPAYLADLGYRLAVARGSPEQGVAPRLLPRGRSALPSPDAAASRRARAIAATAQMTARKGYAALTVEDIASAARIGRGAFYACFRDKQDAYLAAQAEALRGAIAAAATAFSVERSWPERVWSAGEEMLSFVASQPDLSYLGIVEVYAAGETAIHRSEDSRNAFGLFIEPGYLEFGWPQQVERRVCTEAIAGAIHVLMRRQVLRGQTQLMLSLLPQFAYIVLTPFLGPQSAASFVAAKVQAACAAP